MNSKPKNTCKIILEYTFLALNSINDVLNYEGTFLLYYPHKVSFDKHKFTPLPEQRNEKQPIIWLVKQQAWHQD